MKPVQTNFSDVPQGDIHDYDGLLRYFNNQVAAQDTKPHYQTITFVTTGIIPYDGGQTTMLHLGTLLSQQGYTVYYLSYLPQSADDMATDAAFNYAGFQGTCLSDKALETHESDIWIATLWESAYVIKNKPGYKMYFVQDYEPYFYPFGDRYQLAKDTYELGLHMVSLGPWCGKMIQENCVPASPVDVINFPVDTKAYAFKKRDFNQYPHKRTLKIAAYTKFSSPRRAPIHLQMVLANCQKLLKQRGLDLDIYYFGTDKNAKFINGQNLGKLNKGELLDLYHSCDFGIAPSMTNFSLVPFEMMSAGLPLIDFEEGTGQAFIPKNCSLMTRFDETALAQLLYRACQSPKQLAQTVQHAQAHIQNIGWDKTIADFMAILQRLPNGRVADKTNFRDVQNA